MLYQIRKMAVAIMRNCAPESLISTALRRDMNINVPTAPEKWKYSHEELSMEEFEGEAENFKMNQIYSHIASQNIKEGTVVLWLHSLNHRNYPDLCGHVVDYANSIGQKSVAVEDVAERLVPKIINTLPCC
ncbi:hypothetical protein HS088_TW11G00991 [Tripterygium wilfordii]|uniref:Uncharacterized protein n=1 Tax=Tripterygium wilfordii TaxID=458696 RepID=A0A7J7D3K8_TRIWF|nr:hypothetical protein HS088_TW11G00991 [Tripterygium wilfordii]